MAGVRSSSSRGSEYPILNIVSIESDGDRTLRRDKNRIANRTREVLTVDGDHLKVMTVQVNGVRHRGPVPQYDLDPLAFRHDEWIVGVESLSVEPPIIAGMAAGQIENVRALGDLFREGGECRHSPLQP